VRERFSSKFPNGECPGTTTGAAVTAACQ